MCNNSILDKYLWNLYSEYILKFIAGHSGRAVWGVGLGRLIAGIVGSNPAQGMDVCPRLSVLCCPVWVEALRQADHSSKESYHMSK
jgi:hypothetical protein